MFVDPWETYVLRLNQEMQIQRQKEEWLDILNQDQRQRGSEESYFPQTTEHYPETSNESASGTHLHHHDNWHGGGSSDSFHHESHHSGAHWSESEHKHVEIPSERPSSPPSFHNSSHNHNSVCDDTSSQGQVDSNDSVSISYSRLALGRPDLDFVISS